MLALPWLCQPHHHADAVSTLLTVLLMCRIFNGASFVFFSFIGFDCVSTLAEEVKNPSVDMPVGIVGCISFVGVICELTLCTVANASACHLRTAQQLQSRESGAPCCCAR
jgi:amino acid transporter